jgi:hypothetical protein
MIKKATLEELLADASTLDQGKEKVFLKMADITDYDTDNHTFTLGGTEFKFDDHALRQMLQKLKIPAPYYMTCSPELREKQLREGFEGVSNKSQYWFKMKDDTVYGMVPNGYYESLTRPFIDRVVDGLPNNLTLKEYWLDMKSLRMRFIIGDMSFIEKDQIIPGIDVHFSEVNATPFFLQSTMFRLVCENGMMLPEGASPSFKMPMTRFKADQFTGILSSVRERVLTVQEPFANMLESLKEIPLPAEVNLTELDDAHKITQNLVMPSRLLQRDYGALVWSEYTNSENPTVNGYVNAITRTARDLESDDKVKLETTAGSFVARMQSFKSDHDRHSQALEFTLPGIKRLFAKH